MALQTLPLRIRQIAGITCTHLFSLSREVISAINKTRSIVLNSTSAGASMLAPHQINPHLAFSNENKNRKKPPLSAMRIGSLYDESCEPNVRAERRACGVRCSISIPQNQSFSQSKLLLLVDFWLLRGREPLCYTLREMHGDRPNMCPGPR
jgi:hypothetical protein